MSEAKAILSKYNKYTILKVLQDQIGIPREEALKMSSLEVRELLLAHEFTIEAEKRRLEKERKKSQALNATT